MGRPTVDESAQLRKDLLAGARAMITIVGSSALSVDALAREVGVTKRTIYRHFGNKAGLIEAVVQREIARLDPQAMSTEDRVADPLTDLKMQARRYFEKATDPDIVQFKNFLIFECQADPAIADRLDNWHCDALKPLCRTIEHCQTSGVLRTCDTEQLTLLLVDLLNGPAERLRMRLSPEAALGKLDEDTFFTARWQMFMRLAQPDPWADLQPERAGA